MKERNLNAELLNAVRCCNLEKVKSCLEEGADPNYVITPYTLMQRFWGLGKVILTGTLEPIIKMTFGNSAGADVIKGDTILHFAARILRNDNLDSLEIVRALLKAGADKEAQNDQYEKPYHLIPLSFTNKRAQIMLEPEYSTLTSTTVGVFLPRVRFTG